MTVEKLEKAKEVEQLVKRQKGYVNRVDTIKKEMNREWEINAMGSTLKIPKNLNEMILLLVESEHKKVLVKLEKEFEEL